jgi:cell division inhibitor SepF
MARRDHAYDDWYDDTARRDYDEPAWESQRDERSRLELVRRPAAHVELITPHDFADAQTVADRLRKDHVVVVDLRECQPNLAARLTDFCSGLAYALEGGLQLVTDGVVLLTPLHVDVSGDDESAVREPGFFNRL